MTISTADQLWDTITFPADDGCELHGRWFQPNGEARGVVVIVPAMATTAAYYATFASWLRDRGFAVMTFDYRGYGDSLDGPMRRVKNDLVRWALDARDALDHAPLRAEGLPVTWLGHSLGGQLLPFADHAKAARAISVASGSGYWKHNTPSARRKAPLLWKVIAPSAIAVAGYFPGKRLRILGDLPPNVMRQWARWCMTPDYLLGVDRMGHFGFFRHNQVDLWDELILPHLAEA